MSDQNINADALLSAINKEAKSVKNKKVDKEIEELKATLAKEIETAGSLVEKLRATYAMHEELESRKTNKPTTGVKIIGSFNSPDSFNTITSQHAKPGNYYRWGNTHPILYDGRRSNGYKPVLDDKGERVTIGDAVLMSMPEEQYTKTILEPKKLRKTAVRKAIMEEFEETGKEYGVKTFGRIQYDDGEVVRIGEDRYNE